MDQISGNTLHVPGATLSYEIKGAGPVLLLIAGGEGGAAGFNALADQLASQYTVVMYDRRGASQSKLDRPDEEVRLEQHSDDAHHLLAALNTSPAYVFGSSAGALIGLDLVLRYPEQVKRLVAHEPPVLGLLPDFDRLHEEVAETYRREGGLGALRKMVTELGVSYANREPAAELPATCLESAAKRADVLIKYTFLAVKGYRLDTGALASTPVQIVLAVGNSGRETPGYRCTDALAERLGKTVVEFPSHHAGYVSHPQEFAGKLHEVLEGD